MDMAAEEIFRLLGGDEIAHGGAAGVDVVVDLVEGGAVRRRVADHDDRLQAGEAVEAGGQLVFCVLAGRIERGRAGIAEAGDVVAAELHAPAVEIVEAVAGAEGGDLAGSFVIAGYDVDTVSAGFHDLARGVERAAPIAEVA